MAMCSRMSVATLVIVTLLTVCAVEGSSDLEDRMRVLSKQVTALLERRSEDLKSIEESMKKKLVEDGQLGDVKDEIRNLRLEIEQLQKGSALKTSIVNKDQQLQQSSSQDKNDHLTVKWLTNTVTELKTELAEVQTTLNSTVILQNHEQVGTEIALLKSDVQSLNKELESARSKNAKYEADILEMREEIGLLKDQSRATAVMCGKSKNQLKVAQIEWTYNLKTLNEKISALTPPADEIAAEHPSRHQRFLKKRVFDLERTTKHLHRSNEQLQSRILKLEEEIAILQRVSYREHSNTIHEAVTNKHRHKYEDLQEMSNEISGKPSDSLNIEEKLINLGRQQRLNTIAIANLSRQLTNTDKLHMSMLELLENVESIENKIDKNFPEFRKEISKLELEAAEAASSLSMLKEEQTNTRESVKAIGVSVSNLQEKVDKCKGDMKGINETVVLLKKSGSLQTSKLHDHILKAESSTLDLNSTKSTIHLVEELKSFENEYKSIVNKLPHDCSAVSGPDGIYLISPGDGEPILAYCKEGWTTIQKRYDGSVDFNRNWNEYSNGFGSATGEHWLGNRNLFYLTKENCSQLQVNMKDIYGKYWQANYGEFTVADYSAGFKLSVGKYNGNASDALDYQNHMEFSTIDNDRDISNTHCASNYEGGWWFSHCQHANLNGRYNLGLTWFDSSRNEWIAVATSEMRIRRKEGC